jgi:hypothetical protein
MALESGQGIQADTIRDLPIGYDRGTAVLSGGSVIDGDPALLAGATGMAVGGPGGSVAASGLALWAGFRGRERVDLGSRTRVLCVVNCHTEQRMTANDLPEQSQNPVKDPEEWTTGGEPMTGPQASYLKTLMQQAGKPESEFNPDLTKAQASEMIDQLQQATGRGADQS